MQLQHERKQKAEKTHLLFSSLVIVSIFYYYIYVLKLKQTILYIESHIYNHTHPIERDCPQIHLLQMNKSWFEIFANIYILTKTTTKQNKTKNRNELKKNVSSTVYFDYARTLSYELLYFWSWVCFWLILILILGWCTTFVCMMRMEIRVQNSKIRKLIWRKLCNSCFFFAILFLNNHSFLMNTSQF